MTDPLKDVEDKKAQMDMGIMGIRVYEGALSERASKLEAYLVTCAFFIGMFGGSNTGGSDDKET